MSCGAALGFRVYVLVAAAIWTRLPDKRTGGRFTGVDALSIGWAFGTSVMVLIPAFAAVAFGSSLWLLAVGVPIGTAVLT